jgi:hypothetical protein
MAKTVHFLLFFPIGKARIRLSSLPFRSDLRIAPDGSARWRFECMSTHETCSLTGQGCCELNSPSDLDERCCDSPGCCASAAGFKCWRGRRIRVHACSGESNIECAGDER